MLRPAATSSRAASTRSDSAASASRNDELLEAETGHVLPVRDGALDGLAQEHDDAGVGHGLGRPGRRLRVEEVVGGGFEGQARSPQREVAAVPALAVVEATGEVLGLLAHAGHHLRVAAEVAVERAGATPLRADDEQVGQPAPARGRLAEAETGPGDAPLLVDGEVGTDHVTGPEGHRRMIPAGRRRPRGLGAGRARACARPSGDRDRIGGPGQTPRWARGESGLTSASASTARRSSAVSFWGTATSTVTSRSPRPFLVVDAAPLDPEHPARVGAGGQLERDRLALEGRDLDLGAERGLGIGDGHREGEVAAVATEDLVRGRRGRRRRDRPAGPPLRPGPPRPLSRMRWPSLTPAGMRTLTWRGRRSSPRP